MRWTLLDDAVLDAYLAAHRVDAVAHRVAATAMFGSPTRRCTASVATSCSSAFARAGFGAPSVVEQQGAPDPDFPTVAFPNPEEPGAIDLALSLARATSADLVLANDPDADRCAVAVARRRR